MMGDGTLTPTQTRDLLAHLGLKPRKKLGQNFLIDGNIVRKSLKISDLQVDDTVIEIGPGLGTLTGALLKKGAKVYAIEKDTLLVKHLSDTLATSYASRLFLSQGDAVQNPLAGFNPQMGEQFKIISNLPYSIATPWIDVVLSGPLPVSMVLMLQKETAYRLTADPGSKNYGAASIFIQSAYALKPGHKVSHRCFYPVPAVDSVLLNLVRRDTPFVFKIKTKMKIRAFFTHRRKQIGTLLRDFPEFEPWIKYLSTLGISTHTRAEAIPLQHWQKLDEYIF
jgi:16S rRNA (adenine1518-N6/adenine1519-N6)-dimethyltransferase